jgi:hypothetical protein
MRLPYFSGSPNLVHRTGRSPVPGCGVGIDTESSGAPNRSI